MIDYTAAQLAARVKAMALSVCTTGSTSLAATATGYTRAAGSFLADGFAVGMEVTAAGFATAANNGTGVITALTASAMAVNAYTVAMTASGYTVTPRTLAVEAAAAGRTISVGLPAMRAWENTENGAAFPASGIPWVEEQFVPGPTTLLLTQMVEATPMVQYDIYAPAGTGLCAHHYADAIIAHFKPRTALTLANGDQMVVRGDTGPYRSQESHALTGWSVVPVMIPFRLLTPNT